MPPTPRRTTARRFTLALLAGVAWTLIAAWGPWLAAWIHPALLGAPASRNFARDNRDFDVTIQAGRLGWLGFERIEAIAMRGPNAIHQVSTARRDIDLARRIVETDLKILGPMGDDPFARHGLVVHVQRAGFPFTCFEADMAEVWRDQDRSFEALRGGARVEPATSAGGWRLWLFPWGVLPVGLAANLGFWTLLVCGPGLLRDWAVARRRRAGRCTACGYDRRGLPAGPCPECGMAPAN